CPALLRPGNPGVRWVFSRHPIAARPHSRFRLVMGFSYTLVTHDHAGREHARPYTSRDPLAPASVVPLGGRYWLVEDVDDATVHARPARYRLTLRHPDGH